MSEAVENSGGAAAHRTGSIRMKDNATIQDVADAAGVAKSTASLALSGRQRVSPSTRKAVLSAAKRLAFEANPHAKRLSNGRSEDTVCLLTFVLDSGVATLKVQLLQKLLYERGWHAPLHGAGMIRADSVDQNRLVRGLRQERPRALVCFSSELRPETLPELRRYQESGGVVVVYDHPVDLDCDQVIFDRKENTYAATKHLLERGHRQLTFCSHGSITASHPRVGGFSRALSEYGLEPGPDSIFEGGNYEEGGARLAEWFLSLPAQRRPTGVCIVNDVSAGAFINQVQRAGVGSAGRSQCGGT